MSAAIDVEDVVLVQEDDRTALEEAAASAAVRDVSELGEERALLEIAVAARKMPRRVLAPLVAFRRFSNAAGYLLLRALPTDSHIPPTPASNEAPTHYLPMASSVLALVMSVVGDPVGYADEKNGQLLHDICPLPGEEARQENTGSTYFEFHTENAFHPFRPDYLGLVSVRADHENAALTVVASARSIVQELDGSVLEELTRPHFRTRLASSFTRSSGKTACGPRQPAITGDERLPDICVDFHNTEALTKEAGIALERLKGAVQRAAVGIPLGPGDLLVLDNRKAVHGRTTFVPRYDGRDRWLQRMFAVADLRASQHVRVGNGHVCAPLVERASDYGIDLTGDPA